MHSFDIEPLDPRRFLSVATFVHAQPLAMTSGAIESNNQKDASDDSDDADASGGQQGGDANLDSGVNFDDLLMLAKNYGGDVPVGETYDDRPVDFTDLLALAKNYAAGGGAAQAGARPTASLNGGELDVQAAAAGSTKLVVARKGRYINVTSDGHVRLAHVLASSVKSIAAIGGSGDDVMLVAAAGKPALIVGGSGDDTIVTGERDDTVYGGSGDDQIHAGGGDDELVGDAGNDRLWGDGGNDSVDGGLGKDHLDGGKGSNDLRGASGTDYVIVRAKDKTDGDKRDKRSILD